MQRVICIKSCKPFDKGDVVTAFKFGNSIRLFSGFSLGWSIEETAFNKHFMPFRSYYIVEKPPVKKRFRPPKRAFLRIEFKDMPEDILREMYNNIYSYLELTKMINNDLIISFNYSIVTTFEKLEYLYDVLTKQEFKEALQDAGKVFEGIYITAVTVQQNSKPSPEEYYKVYDSFKEDNKILAEFFKVINDQIENLDGDKLDKCKKLIADTFREKEPEKQKKLGQMDEQTQQYKQQESKSQEQKTQQPQQYKHEEYMNSDSKPKKDSKYSLKALMDANKKKQAKNNTVSKSYDKPYTNNKSNNTYNNNLHNPKSSDNQVTHTRSNMRGDMQSSNSSSDAQLFEKKSSKVSFRAKKD